MNTNEKEPMMEQEPIKFSREDFDRIANLNPESEELATWMKAHNVEFNRGQVAVQIEDEKPGYMSTEKEDWGTFSPDKVGN